MPAERIARFLLLPELKLLESIKENTFQSRYVVEKVSEFEVCPKCASKSASVYDRRKIRVKDAPIRGVGIILEIIKRRFFCKPCNKPFTEPVEGIAKSSRTTRRYERSVHWACENFADMQKVRRAYNCSNNYLYKARYSELERKSKEKQTTH